MGVNQHFALRVAAMREVRDSFTRNIGSSPSTPGDLDFQGARINLAFKGLDERLAINLRGEYYDSDNDYNAVKLWQDPVNPDPYVIAEDAISFMRQKGTRTSIEANYALSQTLDLRWLGSWQRGTTTDQADGDRTETARPRLEAGRVEFSDTSLKNNIHEINLISTGAGAIDWVMGGFILEGRVNASSLRDDDHTVDFMSPTSSIIVHIRNHSKSLFGQVNARLGEKSELVAGVRRSWDRQTSNRVASAGGLGATTSTSSQTTGKLAFNHDLARNVMGYASWTKGYKAGGENLPITAPAFRPETNHVLEAGLKSTLLDRRLRLNLTAFTSTYRDIQLGRRVDNLPLTQNAASGKSKGVEIEAVALVGGFTFNAGGGWLVAEFDQDAELQNTLTNRNEVVPAGTVLPFSPKITLNAGISYELDFGNLQLIPRLQYHHLSKSYADPFVMSRSEISSRNVVDAKITLSYAEHLSIDAFVNNLFDNLYSTMQILSTRPGGGTIYGAPRQYGVRVQYEF